MVSRKLLFPLLAALLAVTSLQAKKTRHILYVIENGPNHTGQGLGFHHAVTDHSADVMKDLGQDSKAFTVDVTKDSKSALTAANLKKYDAVVFYTTGELPLSEQQKSDFMKWVKAGHGVVGIHCATDTNYNWPEWGEMMGAYFDGHPWTAGSVLTLRNEDPKFPSQVQWPKEFQWTDEFYQFRNWDRNKVHVLLSADPDKLDMSRKGIKRTDHDFANAWVKYWGKGRVFYTALGHDEHSWDSPDFRKHLTAGIRWADGETHYKVHIP